MTEWSTQKVQCKRCHVVHSVLESYPLSARYRCEVPGCSVRYHEPAQGMAFRIQPEDVEATANQWTDYDGKTDQPPDGR